MITIDSINISPIPIDFVIFLFIVLYIYILVIRLIVKLWENVVNVTSQPHSHTQLTTSIMKWY